MYYVTTTGDKPGIYKDIKQVFLLHEKHEKVEIRSFDKLKEARAFGNANHINPLVIQPNQKVSKNKKNEWLHIYADGSDSQRLNQIGIGVVFLYQNKIVHEITSTIKHDQFFVRNSHEYAAVLNGIQWAVQNGYKKLVIHNDYQNIIQCLNNPNSNGSNSMEHIFKKIVDSLKNVKYQAIVTRKCNTVLFHRADWLSKYANKCKEGEYAKYNSLNFADNQNHIGKPMKKKKTKEEVDKIYPSIKPTLIKYARKEDEWIDWNWYHREIRKCLYKMGYSIKMRKLRNSNRFNEDFAWKISNGKVYIKRK